MQNLHKRIRAARRSAKLTQQQLGDACGVTRNAVTQWEAVDPKKRTTPSLDNIYEISRATTVGLGFLLGELDVGAQALAKATTDEVTLSEDGRISIATPFSEDEYLELQQAADKVGKSPEEFAQEAVVKGVRLAAERIIRKHSEKYAPLIKEMFGGIEKVNQDDFVRLAAIIAAFAASASTSDSLKNQGADETAGD